MAGLKAGLLGLGRGGRQLAEVLLRSSWCELVSVSSRKADRLQKLVTEHPGVSAYNDHRLAIVSRPLDVLFMAIPPGERPDYLRIAAERRIPVWMLSPPLHRFDELVELVRLFERADVPIAAARTWGGESALRPAAVDLERLGPIFLAEGRVTTCWSGELQWRGDAAQAGGGALLDRGYLMLDAIVQLLGVPASVLAVAGRTPCSRAPAVYDTEDTAAVLCRFADGAMATLGACRRSGPDEWSLRVAAREGSMLVTDQQVVVQDRTGQRELLRQDRCRNPLSEQVEDFLSALSTAPRTIGHRLREHLPTMAVMQTAYLSARTGHPETPSRLSEIHRVR